MILPPPRPPQQKRTRTSLGCVATGAFLLVVVFGLSFCARHHRGVQEPASPKPKAAWVGN